MSDEATLVLHVRPARIRAKAAATAEAVSLLRDLGASAPAGGPLSERKGVIWVALPSDRLSLALPRLPRLGYAYAVDLVEPDGDPPSPLGQSPSPPHPSPPAHRIGLLRVHPSQGERGSRSRTFIFAQ